MVAYPARITMESPSRRVRGRIGNDMGQRLDFIQQANAAYLDDLYARFRQDPDSVPEDWALFFAGFELGGQGGGPVAQGAAGGRNAGLVQRFRSEGHLAARLDPLAEDPAPDPLLDPATHGLSEADLAAAAPASGFRGPTDGTLGGLFQALRETYCGSIGVELAGITDEARRQWLEERIEATHNRLPLAPEARVKLLERLISADAFEEFLHTRYPGQKRFSLEGAGALIPLLDLAIERSTTHGAEQIVIGMPHRGRLNVLAHVMEKPLEAVFGEFESNYLPESVQGHGDVKYHMGYSFTRKSDGGRAVHLDLNFNPSHLEFVNPVVLGSVRARQDHMGDTGRRGGVPLLIHGDAAFSGEGIVPETLELAQLPPYETGGTLHVIVNNQVGFTTSPEVARTTRYTTDIARVEDAPVFHVNADDPEAVLQAAAVAVDYRTTFRRDAFVDLIGYRRHGHNELDDPTFTQPLMYQAIARHTPVSRQYAERLVAEGVLDEAAVTKLREEVVARFQEAHRRMRAEPAANPAVPLGGMWSGLDWAGEDWSARTAVPAERLREIIRAAARLPDGFHPHKKIPPLLEERVRMVEEDRIDWGTGEVLAFGSLVMEGKHVRLSGQDTQRGTFSHRHSVLHDTVNGQKWIPLQHVGPKQGRFEVIDTMLSEAAVLGFEYGYSTADPHTLVLWEAQFGDFGNVAQVYIDQFIASAESKWRRMSGLTLLLPHGYEGQGPEHSSARLERFLELSADGNLQVCNLTTPGQLFHALRRQMHRSFRKPLVIMSPKSLLRHRLAVSPLAEFVSGGFRPAIDDPTVDPAAVRQVLLVSGRLFYALHEARLEREVRDTAVVRLEQLYPFPADEVRAILRRYPRADRVRWVQEEPANMGAWRHTRHRLESVLPEGWSLEPISREASPTPASGYYHMHVEQEAALIQAALQSAPPVDGAAVSSPESAHARRRTPAGSRAGGAS